MFNIFVKYNIREGCSAQNIKHTNVWRIDYPKLHYSHRAINFQGTNCLLYFKVFTKYSIAVRDSIILPNVVGRVIQWNLSYPNPLGPGVVHKSEKTISLKLCTNNLKICW